MSIRIIGYDFARAIAIFGMVVVNFKIVMSAQNDRLLWLVKLVGLVDGRAAATFVVLAGVVISLRTQKSRTEGDKRERAKDRLTLLKRAGFLFVIGLLYTSFWPADILHFYGIYIAVAALLLNTRSRWLWVLTGSLVLMFAIALFVFDYDQGWDWGSLTYQGFYAGVGFQF